MLEWSSELYLKFEEERTRAARDLLSRAPDFEPKIVVDLGCGPGNSTLLLRSRFPDATIIGIDNSSNMLNVAQSRVPSASFIQADIAHWRPETPPDFLFANAALHFVPDHYALIQRLVSTLAPSGVIAVQMPNSTHQASHALMRMISAEGPWADRLLPIAKSRPPIGPAEEYYRLLTPLCARVDIWETSYIHPVDGPDQIVEWFEGAELRPFLDPLTEEERSVFLARYRQELGASYDRQPDGRLLLHYPRLFFVARAKG
ncbi:trans-aconitate 2-methyltransferase [Methylocystis bryophila]|uniref:Trans-aconitate 2-methyltransferase n=1 Tax=Methylocystis bryophila TaxID=655015 RepID=A0A1W6MSM8_9HYPH|nr:trans-aconitate 2-methyltransferase [Methylocystis bryophila]ARN80567.1 trans-aconitate 2-methyltransferase [Methylocystis bryophila]BDV40617.1 trans-aconitate 2-methyltransferase [Methylocystis bryophila]